MTENVENLLLEHMKRFQATLDRMERKQDETIARIANLEGSVVSIDNINLRLDRIEQRLELTH